MSTHVPAAGGRVQPLDVLRGLAIFGTIVVFANLWLRRFPSGPMEMLWKWLSDLPSRKAEG